MSAKLFTIGYEGAELSDFIATLTARGVEQIIDVREIPLSRKRGFSKTKLAEALKKKKMSYLHVRALGDPKPGREAAKRGNFAAFRKIYSNHLGSRDAQAALQEISRAAIESVSCLLCFERSFENCHRSIVADALSKHTKFKVEHLYVNTCTEKSGAGHGRQVSRELSLG